MDVLFKRTMMVQQVNDSSAEAALRSIGCSYDIKLRYYRSSRNAWIGSSISKITKN
jgi:hypothetical protein